MNWFCNWWVIDSLFCEKIEFVMLSISPSNDKQFNCYITRCCRYKLSLFSSLYHSQNHHHKKIESILRFAMALHYLTHPHLHIILKIIISGKWDWFWDPLWLRLVRFPNYHECYFLNRFGNLTWLRHVKHVWISLYRYLLCCWGQYYDADHDDDGWCWWW